MSTRLDWRVGPHSGTPEPHRPDPAWHAPPPAAAPSARGPQRRGRWIVFAAAYLGILAVAASAGFGLGRWSELERTARANVENQLAVEALAWRDGDPTLFVSTLDPAAPPGWRADRLADFKRLAPLPFEARVTRLTFIDPSLIRADLAVRLPTQDGLAERWFRWSAGRWYWTAPPEPMTGATPRPAGG